MYKFTRKELIKKYLYCKWKYYFQLADDLLAQKEDRKECKHKWVWNNKLMTNVCSKCNKEPPCPTCGITHTPSPLEGFEEIDDIDWVTPAISKVELAKKFNWLNRNQKKLYQYIKEKKI